MGRQDPRDRPWPSFGDALVYLARRKFDKWVQLTEFRRDQNKALLRRTLFQFPKAHHRMLTAGITAEAIHRFGRIGDNAPVTQYPARLP